MGRKLVLLTCGALLTAGMLWATDTASTTDRYRPGNNKTHRKSVHKSKHTIGSATSGAGSGKITSDATGKHFRKAGGDPNSVTHDLNPQPLPPGRAALVNNETFKTQGKVIGGNTTASEDLNPQPLPPGAHSGGTGGGTGKVQPDLNPQPLPPGVYAPPGQGGPSALKPVGGANKVQ
jgi:hypothetical protein